MLGSWNSHWLNQSSSFRCLLLAVGSVHGGAASARRSAKPAAADLVDTWKWHQVTDDFKMDYIWWLSMASA